MSFVVIIPARFASTRLPGKPLQDINGKPMIVHVHMDNHRLTINVLQWFSRQARGGETRRNNDHETHE